MSWVTVSQRWQPRVQPFFDVISPTGSICTYPCLCAIQQLGKRQPMTGLVRRVLKRGSRLKLAPLGRGHPNTSTMGNRRKPSCSFSEATILLQVREETCASTTYTNYSGLSFGPPDFGISDVPPQARNLQPGVVKTQDPQIERDLHLSLDDLYLGCTKKIKISRRVGGEMRESPTQRRAEAKEDGDTLDALNKIPLFASLTGYEWRWTRVQHQGQNPDHRREARLERRHENRFPQRRRSGEKQKPANCAELRPVQQLR